jgi:AcrR family transcriptional regulator
MSDPRPEVGPSLRERTRSLVRWQVGDAALELFSSQGFEATTVEEIAARAGISRSSFFRYFASKEDVIVLQLEESGAALRKALLARPDDEPPWTAVSNACLDVVERTAGETSALQRGLRVARVPARSPSVRARVRDEMVGWRDLLIPELQRRLQTTDEPYDPRAAALAAAAVACIDVACELWEQCDGERSLAGLLGAALRQFEVRGDGGTGTT